VSSLLPAYAATVSDDAKTVKTWDVTVDTSWTTDVKSADAEVNADETTPVDLNSIPTDTAAEDAALNDSWSEVPLDAASWKEIVVAPKVWIGNYVEVACDKEFFTANACNQCFDWGKKATAEKITGLTDSWTNPNTTEQVIYKDEQKMPEFVNLGWANTSWLTNPEDSSIFYKYSDELAWTDSATWSGKQEFLLEWSKTTPFLESDLGASYTLQSTDKVEWDAVWLLKFQINYHDTDATAKESEAKAHTECVAYYAGTPAPVVAAPVTPQEVTQVKTGPESLVLILVALLLSFGLLKYRKKV
jgi:hypothetical protein